MDWGNSRDGRAPGVGGVNPVLSHFHWVKYRSMPSKASLIKNYEDTFLKYGHQRAKPSGAVFFLKISCNRIYLFEVA